MNFTLPELILIPASAAGRRAGWPCGYGAGVQPVLDAPLIASRWI
jgi:hypothetical protein